MIPSDVAPRRPVSRYRAPRSTKLALIPLPCLLIVAAGRHRAHHLLRQRLSLRLYLPAAPARAHPARGPGGGEVGQPSTTPRSSASRAQHPQDRPSRPSRFPPREHRRPTRRQGGDDADHDAPGHRPGGYPPDPHRQRQADHRRQHPAPLNRPGGHQRGRSPERGHQAVVNHEVTSQRTVTRPHHVVSP